jgi:uncharacterized protein YjbI with pentapeptide repeats
MSATSGIELRGIELRGIELRGADPSRIELSGIVLSGIELNGIELSGIELSGLLARLIELRGIELRGIELRGMSARLIELRGIELRGIELSGTPARARERRVTPLSFEPEIPKSEHGKLSEARVVHHCASAPEPGTVPARPIELSGKEPSSIELSGIELSGLDDRSRALRSTESKLAAGEGWPSLPVAVSCRTSSSVTDSSGTRAYLLPARMPFQPEHASVVQPSGS